MYLSFSIPTPGFPPFYYMLGANLGLLLHGDVPVMYEMKTRPIFEFSQKLKEDRLHLRIHLGTAYDLEYSPCDIFTHVYEYYHALDHVHTNIFICCKL